MFFVSLVPIGEWPYRCAILTWLKQQSSDSVMRMVIYPTLAQLFISSAFLVGSFIWQLPFRYWSRVFRDIQWDAFLFWQICFLVFGLVTASRLSSYSFNLSTLVVSDSCWPGLDCILFSRLYSHISRFLSVALLSTSANNCRNFRKLSDDHLISREDLQIRPSR